MTVLQASTRETFGNGEPDGGSRHQRALSGLDGYSLQGGNATCGLEHDANVICWPRPRLVVRTTKWQRLFLWQLVARQRNVSQLHETERDLPKLDL